MRIVKSISEIEVPFRPDEGNKNHWKHRQRRPVYESDDDQDRMSFLDESEAQRIREMQ